MIFRLGHSHDGVECRKNLSSFIICSFSLDLLPPLRPFHSFAVSTVMLVLAVLTTEKTVKGGTMTMEPLRTVCTCNTRNLANHIDLMGTTSSITE